MLLHTYFKIFNTWNTLHTIKIGKANLICHLLRTNCLLRHVTEGKIEVRIEMTRRRGRGRKRLLHDLKNRNEYWKLKKEALELSLDDAMTRW